ncbi:UDP-N-acetylmuramoyl-L-alanine--D-glutamate ligase [Alkaliphilus serpentinus]|uniref:UDP-N-acetylmuramoylalanine--D-glutamate ligase n=1 Tax=Alkaliphilus serpentinus TaxID=1482731 RepID=A0A833HRJ6_9FIRM|nr:UDP-N-acetylmuramoyl-L-alanine--D-glutamate ligase [Alkaliphilus serpentinus]KAB3533195.1 UDP-N-acetylmuramoyl-L-alanine--D-glutamate ligase [Alkaliphilus serpentinus]
MNLQNKRVLVIGLAVTGVPLVKVLVQLGSKVIVNDLKSKDKLTDALEELKGLNVKYIFEEHPNDLDVLGTIDLVVVSPGVPLDIPFINLLREKSIDIIGEIELAYRLGKADIVAITGTNGKTTTTALTGKIFKDAGRITYVVGNIGVPAISKALESQQGDNMIMEVSSFQLESISKFHPKVAAILNLTPDHLNRHKTMENYLNAKLNIFMNQNSNDYAVINYDDEVLREASKRLSANILFFSRKSKLEKGVYVKDQKIVVKLDDKVLEIIPIDEIKIPGNHNLENALAATAMAFAMGIEPMSIADSLRTFEGVEHRIEFVDVINGVTYINDSKGTNPDASIKAVEAVKEPIILLAGGMDKGSDFTEFIKSFKGKVKALVVYGETAEKIKGTAISLGFSNVVLVKDLQEAVEYTNEIATAGDSVLLSPACASWDMYPNFEERGRHFKELVSKLRRS